jgi:DNA-binding CsgD family transcriptional regulator
MAVQHDRLSIAYELMLAAAAGERPFQDALSALCAAYGAAGGVLFEMNRRTGEILNWVSPDLIQGVDAYSEHLNSINPRMQFSLQHPAGHVAFESMFISDQAIKRHEFYDWLGRSHDFQTFIGSRLYDDGDITVFHSVEFSKSHGHADNSQVEAFRRSAKALGNAWRASKLTGAAEDAGTPNFWTPENMPWAIFAFSELGRVLSMNQAARTLINRNDVLALRDGFLNPYDQLSVAPFLTVLRSALHGVKAETLVRAGVGPPLLVQVWPIKVSDHASRESVSALAYVWDPSQHRNRRSVFKRVWRLTDSEARLAELLCSGTDLSDAAEKLGVSRNTVRNHLQSVFNKTGTRKQAELLIRLIGVIET